MQGISNIQGTAVLLSLKYFFRIFGEDTRRSFAVPEPFLSCGSIFPNSACLHCSTTEQLQKQGAAAYTAEAPCFFMPVSIYLIF